MGEHTVFMRKAAAVVQKRERHQYQWLVALLAVVLIAAGTYAYRVRHQLNQQRSAAEDLFYSMKSLDLDIGNLQKIVQASNYQGAGLAEIQKYRGRRIELEKNYDRFLATLNVYDPKLTPKQKLILRVARIFGECEIDMPKNFEAEIDRYIKIWQSNDRLRSSLERAKLHGYVKPITDELLAARPPAAILLTSPSRKAPSIPYNTGPLTAKGYCQRPMAIHP